MYQIFNINKYVKLGQKLKGCSESWFGQIFNNLLRWAEISRGTGNHKEQGGGQCRIWGQWPGGRGAKGTIAPLPL